MCNVKLGASCDNAKLESLARLGATLVHLLLCQALASLGNQGTEVYSDAVVWLCGNSAACGKANGLNSGPASLASRSHCLKRDTTENFWGNKEAAVCQSLNVFNPVRCNNTPHCAVVFMQMMV